MHAAEIGFIPWNTLYPQDGGKGPVLYSQTYNQRPVSDKGIKALLVRFAQDGCKRFELENLVKIAIDPDCIHLDKVLSIDRLNMMEEYTDNPWKSNAGDFKAHLLNGQHRFEANSARIAAEVRQLAEVQEKIQGVSPEDTRYTSLIKEKKKLEKLIQQISLWGVQLYDLSKTI